MYMTSNINDKVQIRMQNEGIASLEPINIPDFFTLYSNKYNNQSALAYKDDNDCWKRITYAEYNRKIRQISKAFIKLGLECRSSVGILAFNCPEWFYAELATIFAGGICAGIYTTNSADSVQYVLENSNATILIVDDNNQMQKINSIKSKLKNIKAVIQMHGPFENLIETEENYYKWSDIEEMDTSQYETELEDRIQNIVVNECCSLIYTSGTTGQPKGVMLSHDNLTFPVNTLIERLHDIKYGEEVFISYLPLNHIAAQMLDVFLPIAIGGCVYFADKNALKGSIITTLVKARPTRFMGVPRVYEKIQEKLIEKHSQLNWITQYILNTAKTTVTNYHLNCMRGTRANQLTYEISKRFVNKIKTGLGFDRCKSYLTGAAPLSEETKKNFLGIDMKLCEVYGLSEAVGVTLCAQNFPNSETIGNPLAGTLLKIKNPDSNGHGEICVKSRHIFMGYLNDAEKTEECFDDNGYFCTGDIGYIDENEFVYISGRIKEIIITSGAENISPVYVENIVKKELSLVSNALLVGDKRKFLTILLTIKTKLNENGCPTNYLQTDSLQWMKNLNLQYTTVTEILEAGPCPIVLKSIQDGIDRYNSAAISNAQRIQKFTILQDDFSVMTGEFGPTLKLRRSVVTEKYKEIINKMYQ